MPPKQILGALGAPLALLLALTGVAAVAGEVLVAHPEMLRFSREGRAVDGVVVAHVAPIPSGFSYQGGRNHSVIQVDDPGLGIQTVEIYGPLPVGQRATALCLTALHRCESADVVKERLAMWPLTPLGLCGAVELALAAALFLAGHQRRRRHAARDLLLRDPRRVPHPPR